MNGCVRMVLLALVAALSLLAAGPAAAKKKPAPAPAPVEDAIAVASSDGAGEWRIEAGPVTPNVGSAGTQSLGGGCRAVYAWRSMTNSWGGTLWRYRLDVHWCWDGTRVTWIYRHAYGETYFPGWSWSHHDASNGGGVGSWSAYTWRQGYFRLCAAWCVQHVYPWVAINARGDGWYTWSTG